MRKEILQISTVERRKKEEVHKIPYELLGKKATCAELLHEYQGMDKKSNSSKIKFQVIEEDVYNITAPFDDGESVYIAGRVEKRDSEQSRVVFFKEEHGTWKPVEELGALQLQDPFLTKIDGQFILGGVEIFKDDENSTEWNYRTLFYKGDSVQTLKPFVCGPDKMKDIRLCQLKNGRILVMTRPQGEVGGRGKIGYTIIDSLEQLSSERILEATILENQFTEDEWGGCNEVHLLQNGLVGILSHIAKFDAAGNRHYYSSAFCFDPSNGDYSKMKIIAVRNNFEDGPSKRPDLRDVIFSGGLIRNEDGTATLYCGVSDAEGHMIEIEDPFKDFEIFA